MLQWRPLADFSFWSIWSPMSVLWFRSLISVILSLLIPKKVTITKIHHLIRLNFERSEHKKSQCATTLVFTSYCCRSVRALTDYLKYLDNDHLAYSSMLTWKHEYEMYERWPLCSLCEKLHRWVLLVWQKVVDLISDANSWVLLLRQLIINYSVKYSTDLLFLQYFFFRLKPKQCKICQYK